MDAPTQYDDDNNKIDIMDVLALPPGELRKKCEANPELHKFCRTQTFLDLYVPLWQQDIGKTPQIPVPDDQSDVTMNEADLPQFTYEQTFRTIKSLGQGSFGSVLLVKNIFTNELRTVKFIPMDQITEQRLLDTELNAWKRISLHPNCHPHVVCLYEYRKNVSFDNKPYYALIMEYIPNSMDMFDFLADVIDYQPTLPMLKTMLLQLATGLKHIHDMGVFHKDIKHENIMVQAHPDPQIGWTQPTLKYIDFGLSCVAGEPACQTLSGTPVYLDNIITKRVYNEITGPRSNKELMAADIYALGVTMYLSSMYYDPLFDVVSVQHPYIEMEMVETFDNMEELRLYVFSTIATKLATDENYPLKFNYSDVATVEYLESIGKPLKGKALENKVKMDNSIANIISGLVQTNIDARIAHFLQMLS